MSRQKKQIKLDLALIQRFYDTQQKIFQEDSRHVVESFCRTEQLDQITEKANNSFKKEKEHFEIARSILVKSVRKKITRDRSVTLINTSSIQNRTVKIPGLFDLTLFALKQSVSAAPPPSKSSKDKDKEKDSSHEIIDLFTFSIVPSYFDFFWVDTSIKKLAKYFTLLSQSDTISNEQYNQIARSVFVTPSFLLYSRYAFQPIFSKLLNYTEKNIGNFFKENLSQNNCPTSISRYNYMIPKEVFIAIICSKQPTSVLFRSFLNVALSSPSTMHAFNLLHFSQIPSKEILKAARSCLKSDPSLNLIISEMTKDNPCYESLKTTITELSNQIKTNKQFVKEIVKEINETNRYTENDDEDIYESEESHNNYSGTESSFITKNLFNENDQKYCPEIFQPFFLSSNDLSFFDFFFGKTSIYKIPDRSEYYRVYSDQEETKDNLFNANEATMAHGNMPTPYLRHLLQLSDPLPKFKAKPPNINTIEEFINTYFVERGDIRTYAQRKYNAECFLFFKNMFPSSINDTLKKVGFSRINDIMALSAFANIDKKLEFLDGNSIESRENMNLILDSQKKDFATFKDPHSDTEYFKTPKLFVEDFLSLTSKYRQVVFSGVNLNKIVYSKLLATQKIDLQTFIEHRTSKIRGKQNLKKLDQEFSSALIYNTLINKFIDNNISINGTNGEPTFDKGVFLKRFINTFELNYFNTGYQGRTNYENIVNDANSAGEGVYNHNDYLECKYIGDMIIEAFQEKSLMRKIDILSLCFSKIKNELNKIYPPEKSPLAEPEFEPTICAIIMRVNPPNFYSNYIFLHDMIGSLSPEDIFVGSSRSVYNYLGTIIRCVFENNEEKIQSCMLFNDDDY